MLKQKNMREFKTKMVFAHMLPFVTEANVGKVFDIVTPDELLIQPLNGYLFVKPLKVKQTQSAIHMPNASNGSLSIEQIKNRFFTHMTLSVVMASGKRFKDEPTPPRPYTICYLIPDAKNDIMLSNVNGKKEIFTVVSGRLLTGVHEVSWLKLLNRKTIGRYINFFILKKR